MNGLTRAVANGESLVVSDGFSTRYQGSIHDGVWSERMILCHQSGWYRRSFVALVPEEFSGTRAFFSTRRKNDHRNKRNSRKRQNLESIYDEKRK